MPVVLHQFVASHFNEKARWALDWKGIAHERVTYLPGPHMLPIQRLSGNTQTPVLDLDGEIVAGSAAIVARLDRHVAAPPLLPDDDDARRAALGWQERYDDEVGPAVRAALFSVLVDEGDYLCRIFARTKPAWKRGLYRALFPAARGMIAKGNGVVDPADVERAFARTASALDEDAKQTEATGYLVGDAFTIADLAVAALLAPLAKVAHPDMAFPDDPPASMVRFHARYADHPAVAWVRGIYARHRP